MISVLQEPNGGVFNERNSPMMMHSFPSRSPFHFHTAIKKHLSPSTLPPFITSYIGESTLKPTSRSYSQPCNDFKNTSFRSHSLAKDTNKSILKKPSFTSFSLRLPHHTLQMTPERPRSVPCAKKVDFRQDVLVIHFDKNEGDHVRCENASLTLEPKNKKKLIKTSSKKRDPWWQHIGEGSKDDRCLNHHGTYTPQLRYTDSGTMKASSYTDDDLPLLKSRSAPFQSSILVSSTPSHIFKNDPHKPPLAFRPSRPPLQATHNNIYSSTLPTDVLNNKSVLIAPKNNTNDDNVDYLKNVEFKFFEDDFHKLWLRFVVDLGSGVSANDVLVKANLTGNKVRIVGFKVKNRVKEDFNKRCLLPVEVDPYMVSARMDLEGKLFVEGLVTNKKRML